MRYPSLTKLLLAPVLACTTSCAAMFTGTSNEVLFTSEPSGAIVEVGDLQVTTPGTLDIPKSAKEASYRHPETGEVRVVELARSTQGGMVLMDFLFTPGFGLSGLLIDGMTSAIYKHASTSHVDFRVPQNEDASTEAE